MNFFKKTINKYFGTFLILVMIIYGLIFGYAHHNYPNNTLWELGSILLPLVTLTFFMDLLKNEHKS